MGIYMKKQNFKKGILAILVVIVACVLLGLVYEQLSFNRTTAETTSLSAGWTCSLNGETLESQGDGNLSDYTFSNLERGDVVVLERTLPDWAEGSELVSILVQYSAVDVYVDDVRIYSYGQDLYEAGQFVGNGYHYVSLPEDASGKQIRFEITVAEDNAFSGIDTPKIGNGRDIYREYISDNVFGIFIGVFLLILGIILLFFSCIASAFNKNYLQLVYIALFSFSISLWYLCDIKVFSLAGMDLSAMATVKFFSLYFAPIPFALITATMIVGKPGWRMRFLYNYAKVTGILLIVASCLHYFNIVHYTQLLTFFHILLGVGVVFLVIATVTATTKREEIKTEVEQSKIIIYFGLAIFLVCAIIDVVKYNFRLYVLQNDKNLSMNLVLLGTLIVILCFLLSYIFRIYEVYVSNAQKEWYEKLAYTDMLCKISNRAKYSEDIAEIVRLGQKYAFINMDVDGLKKVNDTMGHEMGDRLLSEFSNVLQEAFDHVGDAYRMGGDEFLVIVKEEQLDNMNFAINQMNDLAQKHSAGLSFTIEFSYGIAKSSEFLGYTPEQLYSLADKRMYSMKSMHKKRRQA